MMKTLSFLKVALVVFLTGSLSFLSGAAAQPGIAPEYSQPLGSAMETYPYPFPVKFLPLEIEGQPVRMAYMDVQFQFFAPPPRSGVVLLLHGKNFYGSYWENTINVLAAQGYRVIVPDQIGFGKSSKPDIHYSFDLLAANTAALLDELKIGKVAVVGHSMGGMLAVRFARNYPQRTSQLVLENPIGLEDYRFKVPVRTTQDVYESELKNTSAASHRAFLKTYFVQWKPEYESFVEVRTRVALGGEYPRWAKAAALTYQMIYQQPVRHEFHLIEPPTLLIIGQEDRTTLGRGAVSPGVLRTLGNYPQLGKEAARDIPNAKLVELPGVGHIPHLEAPEKFHRALLDFLKKNIN
jgi:pimeloyl-ACP methyl ester carboxylesterase